MRHPARLSLPAALAALVAVLCATPSFVSPPVVRAQEAEHEDGPWIELFDGESLDGWTGDETLWRVEDGAIVGTTDGNLPHNTFLAYEQPFGDFVLQASFRLRGGNSGVQFRSELHDDYIVSGYQADLAPGYYGLFYEERGRGILQQPDPAVLERAGVDEPTESSGPNEGWNHYVVTAIGSRITFDLNGVRVMEIDDPDGAREGIIALQLHVGTPMEVRFREIRILPL